MSRVFSPPPPSLSNERQKRDPQKDVSREEGGGRVEMNWQLLIKIVSSSLLQPRSRGCSPFSGEIGGEELFRLANLTKQGRGGGVVEGVGVSSRDAVSILFVHANYSSRVTLLEIEGNRALPPFFLLPREKKGRGRPISSSSCPGDFLMWALTTHPPLRILVAPGRRRICPRVTTHRARCEGDFNLSHFKRR